MGVFDYIIPECPLPDDAAQRVREWQTKSFEQPWLCTYHITAGGRLLRELVHYEDRSDQTVPKDALRRVLDVSTRVHDGWEDTGFEGVLRFYGEAGTEWVEYEATFVKGAMTALARVQPTQ